MSKESVRDWIVLGPMGSDYISYDPPDFEAATRIVVEVTARTARDAVLTAYKTMDRHDKRNLIDATRGAGRNPLAALKPLAYPPCYEDCANEGGWADENHECTCPRCLAFMARSEAICKALDAKYGA